MNATLFRFLIFMQERLPSPAPTAAPSAPVVPGLPPATPMPTPVHIPTTPPPWPHVPASPKPAGPEIPVPSGEEVKEGALDLVDKIAGFFKYDFFPNLWKYLTLVFMLVLCVVLFSGINLVVRSITDPIMHKVLRFKEDSRFPALFGGIVSIVLAILFFQWLYTAFPALQPPVEFVINKFR